MEEDAIYDVTIDKKDFHHTLEESLSAYEKEEKYEECAKIKEAMTFLTKKKRLQVLELISGYANGLITDRECNELSDIILGEIRKYKK